MNSLLEKLEKLAEKLHELKKSVDAGSEVNSVDQEHSSSGGDLIKFLPNGQWILEKAAKAFNRLTGTDSSTDWTKFGHQSMFDMSHVNHVAGLKSHDEAKKYAHSIVDSSNAREATKKKVKMAIDNSKNINDVAKLMSNHILAHQGLKVMGGKK